MELVSGLGELTFDLEAEPGVCAVCHLPPLGPRLTLGIERGAERFELIACRHCIAEYAPGLLAELEGAAE